MYVERESRVRCAVVWERGPTRPGRVGRVLPDGCMDLLLWNGALTVAGPDTRAYLTTERRGEPVIGLRLPPGAGPQVFGVRAHELRDQRVPLDALWPQREVRVLHERLLAAPDPAWALEAVAARRLAEAARTARDPREAPLVAAMAGAAREGASVREVARRVGLSERQVHRRALDSFGYGVKTLARVLRLRSALLLAEDGVPPARTAARAGYADQAHFAREVKALAGVPLTTLLGARGAAHGSIAGQGNAGQDRGAKRSTPLPSGSSTVA